jgi:hypothetical protein
MAGMRGEAKSPIKGASSKGAQTKPGRRAVRHIGFSKAQFDAIMEAAKKSGLLGEKSGRLTARVSPVLIKRAKQQTGIDADSELIQFALATVALKDDFAKAFKESRGKVSKDIKLGF